jgi:hypothetical protein
VNAFNRRHFLAFFRYFDPVANKKETAINPQYLGENLKDGSCPNGCEPLKIQTASMEKIQDTVITTLLKSESSNNAGDTHKVGPHRHTGDTGYEPQESPAPGT